MRWSVPIATACVLLVTGCAAEQAHVVAPVEADAWNLPVFRQHLADQRKHVEMMSQALALHDQGKVEDAHGIASQVAYLLPEHAGEATRWFVEETKGGEAIPQGGHIRFSNQSEQKIPSVTLRYRRGPVGAGLERVKVTVTDLSPGETRRVYVEDLPQGSARLWVTAEFGSEGRGFRWSQPQLSGRFYGPSFGFAPDIYIVDGPQLSFDPEP